MSYRELPLPPQCADRIEALWRFDATSAALHPVLPDGRMDVLVRFERHEHGRIANVRLVIAGPSQRPGVVPAGERTSLVGIRFRSGWGGVCLQLQAAELLDQVLLGDDASRVLGPLAEPLLRATDIDALLQLMQHTACTLASRTPGSPTQLATAAAIDLLHGDGGSTPIATLASRLGRSERSLRRHLHDAVGLPAKSLAAILRFRRTLRLLDDQPTLALSAAAAEAGYSDQAHMSREFKRYGGFSPSARPTMAPMYLSMQSQG
ncbi:MAG: hypothetical protein RLZZ618_3771 [Pseudomonadota bacterium]